MIGFDEALALVAQAARPLGVESLALAEAKRRVLAAPVIAMVDSPPADVSAMDGYAVRDSDLPGRLDVAGESFPGGGAAALGPGQCARIFTGGPVPEGANRVVIQEDVTREGGIAVFGEPGPARHIRRRGGDFTRGKGCWRPASRSMHAPWSPPQARTLASWRSGAGPGLSSSARGTNSPSPVRRATGRARSRRA